MLRILRCLLGVWSPSRIMTHPAAPSGSWLQRWEWKVDQKAIDSGEAAAMMTPSPEVMAGMRIVHEEWDKMLDDEETTR